MGAGKKVGKAAGKVAADGAVKSALWVWRAFRWYVGTPVYSGGVFVRGRFAREVGAALLVCLSLDGAWQGWIDFSVALLVFEGFERRSLHGWREANGL